MFVVTMLRLSAMFVVMMLMLSVILILKEMTRVACVAWVTVICPDEPCVEERSTHPCTSQPQMPLRAHLMMRVILNQL